LPIVWIFFLLTYLSDRRGPAASLTTEALNNAFLFSGFAEKRGGRGEVPPSAGRGEPKTPQPGFAGAEALARGNPRSEVPPPEAFDLSSVPPPGAVTRTLPISRRRCILISIIIIIIGYQVHAKVLRERGWMVSLSTLKKGDRFRIGRVTHVREIGKKLADMGFTRGTEGMVVRSALLHDPIQIRILGYNVSIRRAEAAGIKVDQLSPDIPVAAPKAEK